MRGEPAEEHRRRGSLVVRALSGMRYPWLFSIAAFAFVVDVMVPDVVPFIDELLLLALTTGLGLLRKRRRKKQDGEALGDEAAVRGQGRIS